MYRELLQNQFVNREEALRRGLDEIEVAEILRQLGIAFRETGDFDSAEQLLSRSSTRCDARAEDRTDFLIQREIVFIRNDLAVFFDEIGRLEDAHTQFVEALRIAEYTFSTDHLPARSSPLKYRDAELGNSTIGWSEKLKRRQACIGRLWR